MYIHILDLIKRIYPKDRLDIEEQCFVTRIIETLFRFNADVGIVLFDEFNTLIVNDGRNLLLILGSVTMYVSPNRTSFSINVVQIWNCALHSLNQCVQS